MEFENKFVPLRAHTDYSLIDGLIKPKAYAEALAEKGFPAGAITDLNNIFAAVKFQKAAFANNVKPILGADFTVSADGLTPGVVTVLCLNSEGYRDLNKLLSNFWLLDHEVAGEHRLLPLAELIASDRGNWAVFSGGPNDLVGKAALAGERSADAFSDAVGALKAQFGDRFYLGLARDGFPSDQEINQATYEMSVAHDVPLLALSDIRFMSGDNHEHHHARVCVSRGERIDDVRSVLDTEYTPNQCLYAPDDYAGLFSDVPEAVANTAELAKRCSHEIVLGQNHLPRYMEGGEALEQAELVKQAQAGLDARINMLERTVGLAEDKSDYQKRLEVELDVISGMGFSGYFLVVADFIQWSKDQGIPVGPGRGSGAGSLVAYALGITELDPLRYGLLFERFLNPERVSMPDFDIDFCRDGRDRVIDYVAEKYGREKVSQIVTFGTIAARAAIRDSARVLGKPYGLADRLAKMVPGVPDTLLSDALVEGEPLEMEIETSEEAAEVVELAQVLEGVVRNVGKHAGGAVIAPGEISDWTPLYKDPDSDGQPVSMYDKNDVEDVGLVKFDFLGLKTLTVLDIAKKYIKSSQGVDLDFNSIPLDDPETLQLLRDGNTTSVFQLESSGMRQLLVRLAPDSFEDLVALVALYRPGPLGSGMVDDFIDRKHGRKELAFPHPLLAPVLSPTYGVILYQEQVMQAAQVLANYSLGGADLLRRAMGKKKPEEMEKQRSVFTEGAAKNGLSEADATYIFNLIESFAGYGFNKSHSAAYALLSFQTAYLKQHYPAEYAAAVMTADQEDTDKLAVEVLDAKRQGLEVLPPSVSICGASFAVVNGGVAYSLAAIKGLSPKVVKGIVEARGDQPFSSFADFVLRSHGVLTAAHLKKLALAGALDEFTDKKSVYAFRAFVSENAAAIKKLGAAFDVESSAQGSLFGDESSNEEDINAEMKRLPFVDPALATPTTVLSEEYKALGLYISAHPVDLLPAEELPERNLADFIAEYDGIDGDEHIESTVVGAIVNKRVAGPHAFLTIDDGTEQIDVPVFERTHKTCMDVLVMGALVTITGKVNPDRYTGKAGLMAETVEAVELEKAPELAAAM